MNFITKLGELGRIIKSKRSLDNRGEELANTDKELLAEADAAVGLIDSLQRTVEGFGMEMKAVIPLSNLRRLANEGETLHGIDYRFGVAEETMVNLYGLAYINAAKVQVSYMGKTYTIATRIHNGTFTVNVWDESGSTSVGDNKWDEKNQLSVMTDWLQNLLEKEIRGIIHCSGCNKEMLKEDVAREYFAGRYCKDC